MDRGHVSISKRGGENFGYPCFQFDSDQSQLQIVSIQSQFATLFESRTTWSARDHFFFFTGLMELFDLLAFGCRDSSAEIGLFPEDCFQQPEGWIPSVQQQEVVGPNWSEMAHGKFPFADRFRADNRIQRCLAQDIEHFRNAHHGARIPLSWDSRPRNDRLSLLFSAVVLLSRRMLTD